jgi:hypothetical protein
MSEELHGAARFSVFATGNEVVILCCAPSCPYSSLRMEQLGESILFEPAQQTTTCLKTRIYFIKL